MKNFFSKKAKEPSVVRVFLAKQEQWTQDDVNNWCMFLGTETGRRLMGRLNLDIAVTAAWACAPDCTDRDYRAGTVYGRQLDYKMLQALSFMKTETQSDEPQFTDEQLDQIIQDRANGRDTSFAHPIE